MTTNKTTFRAAIIAAAGRGCVIIIAIFSIAILLVSGKKAAAFTASETLSHCVSVVNARHLPGSEGKVHIQTDFSRAYAEEHSAQSRT